MPLNLRLSNTSGREIASFETHFKSRVIVVGVVLSELKKFIVVFGYFSAFAERKQFYFLLKIYEIGGGFSRVFSLIFIVAETTTMLAYIRMSLMQHSYEKKVL